MLGTLFYKGPSPQRLSELARNGELDPKAPIQGMYERHVNVSPHIVWAVLSDLEGWPTVVPGVTAMRAPERLEPGAEFLWNNGGAKLNSTLQVIDGPRELTWTGRAFGGVAIHRNLLLERDGGTLLRSEESMSGPGLQLIYTSRQLIKGLTQFVEAFAQAAQDRAA